MVLRAGGLPGGATPAAPWSPVPPPGRAPPVTATASVTTPRAAPPGAGASGLPPRHGLVHLLSGVLALLRVEAPAPGKARMFGRPGRGRRALLRSRGCRRQRQRQYE